ncbi:MAG: transglycosylase domain-containing protein [Oscillospiraceae bacterium]|nr:transglycosylase domain-containing protein [Oscillospiraceae bacterium]
MKNSDKNFFEKIGQKFPKKEKNITTIDFEEPEKLEESAQPDSKEIEKTSAPSNERKNPRRSKYGKLSAGQKTKSVFAVIGTTFLTIFLVAVITVCIVAVALTVYVMQFAENSFDIDLKEAEMNFNSIILVFDEDEDDWVETKRISSDENRVWVDVGEMPGHLIDAIIANEDHRYFDHDGVDWYRTAGVIVSAALGGDVQGGSTITQQLVKNVTGDDKVSAGRKLREIFRAISLEQKYTKLDILESYLNRIGFGGSSYGVGSAAWYYFEKTVEELSVSECALLAAVIPSPHNYNPYINSELAKKRHTIALQQMYYNGFISTAEYEEAKAEELRFRMPVKGDYFGYIDERYDESYGFFGESEEKNLYYEDTPWDEIRSDIPYKWNGDYEITQNWYTDAVIWQVATHLAKLRGVSYDKALELIKGGGYTIYSNEDLKIQKLLEERAADPMSFLRYEYPEGTDKINVLQGGFVVLDYGGRVVALIGGFGEKPGDNCFNRATQSVRAIGSTVKPIAVYAPAINSNKLTYSTMTRDASGLIRSNPNDPNSPTELWPANYAESPGGSGVYRETWFAVQQSLNTISVRTLQKVGFKDSYSMLTDKLGISTLDPDYDMNWSPLALGAFRNGINLLELAGAYQIFGNGGVYYEPYLYEKVVDHNGKIILEQNYSGTRAIESDSAWIVNRMMKKVIEDVNGSGPRARIDNIEVIGKTGTSNDEKNLLFCGLTPEYVGVYRVGYDNGREIEKWGSGGNWKQVALVWGETMAHISDNSVPKNFTPDSTVLEKSYCRHTGLLATATCPNTAIGYYRPSGLPQACTPALHNGGYYETYGDKPDTRPVYN